MNRVGARRYDSWLTLSGPGALGILSLQLRGPKGPFGQTAVRRTMRMRTKFEDEDDRIDYYGIILERRVTDLVVIALDALGWKIVRQTGPTYPGEDTRWPMMLPQAKCPSWAMSLELSRPAFTVIKGDKKDD
jgi:hypothetical protein